MSREMNMPVQRDVFNMNSGGSRKFSPNFVCLPTEDGKVAHNKLFFSLYRPASWKFFQENQVGGQLSVPEDLWTFYFRLFGHYIENFPIEGSTNTRTAFAICRKSLNEYLVKTLGQRPIFVEDKCPACEEAAIWWAKWKDSWKALGIDRYKLEKDEYKKIVEKDHPEMKEIRDEASKFNSSDRFVFMIFDYSKVLGERKMDEGEENVDFQSYFGPKKVFDGLYNIHTMGVKFWDIENPRVVVVTRDTSKGVRMSDYTINLFPDAPDFNAEEKAYLEDERNLPDPSDQILLLSYDEMSEHLGLHSHSGGNGSTTKKEEKSPEKPAPTPTPSSGVPSRRRGAPSADSKPADSKPTPVSAGREEKPASPTPSDPTPSPDSTPSRRRRGSDVW
jgi:hypothetical protein